MFLTLTPTAWVAIEAGLRGTYGRSANLPSPCLATLTPRHCFLPVI